MQAWQVVVGGEDAGVEVVRGEIEVCVGRMEVWGGCV